MEGEAHYNAWHGRGTPHQAFSTSGDGADKEFFSTFAHTTKRYPRHKYQEFATMTMISYFCLC